MTTLPTISPQNHVLLEPEPLTPTSFSSFGTAIHAPLPQHVRSYPPSPPTSALHPTQQHTPQPANQSTALKTSPISPLTNNYPAPSQSNNYAEAKGLMSIFSCFPRRNTYLDPTTGKLRLRLEILERHPYTTQTFCPFNFSSASSPTSPTSFSRSRSGLDAARASRKTYFLVVVAPTLDDPRATPPNPPDLSRVRAFLAPVTADGGLGMAVTYAPGTWHAPMVVLGERRVDFLVSQFANGRGVDDCQEVLIGGPAAGEEGGSIVEVDLKELGLGEGSEEEVRLWGAKL